MVENRHGNMQILICDDDPTSREMLGIILFKEGFRVLTAVNGLEGRLLAEKEAPDLIIMDINMPVEDGLTACRILKTTAATSDIPVIFISSVEDVSAKINGFNAGGIDYITKPYQILEVIARVRLQIRLHQTYHSMVSYHLEQLQRLSEAQKSILIRPEDFPEANFAVIYLPAQAAGGDFYDVVAAGAEIVDYLVADISGHHAGTALPASALKALLQQNISLLYTPAENLQLVNRHLRPVLNEDQYATLVYARLNRTRMRLSLVNAGHPSAILQKAKTPARVLAQSGDGLGIFDHVSLDVMDVNVAPGDRLFLYSDGVIEQNAQGRTTRKTGIESLCRLIDASAALPLQTAVDHIRVHTCPPASQLDDDVVLLGFEVT
jgi:sigma-B regulation protein RsbU (phosphoserine phosphatase)